MSKAAMNAIVYGLVGIIVAMGIVYMFPVKCKVSVVQEGFANLNTNTKCPTGTKTFTDRLGNLSCCKGQVNGSSCEGNVTCSFSSNAGKNIPFCNIK
jgi:hypothetical protein